MGNINFKNYIRKFEREVLIKGINNCTFNSVELVSARNNPINSSVFASKMGRVIPTDAVIAMDYYGYYKKSRGFLDRVIEERKTLGSRQLKMINSIVVHFNSIKMEDLVKLTNDHYILSNFAEFKQTMLRIRGFLSGD